VGDEDAVRVVLRLNRHPLSFQARSDRTNRRNSADRPWGPADARPSLQSAVESQQINAKRRGSRFGVDKRLEVIDFGLIEVGEKRQIVRT
jgi:hypothetical protein